MNDRSKISFREIARKVADAKTEPELYSILVNELRPFFSFSQGAVVRQSIWGFYKIIALSGLVEIEQSGPYPLWLRRLSRALPRTGKVETFDATHVANLGNWEKFAADHLIVIPLNETYLSVRTLLLFRPTTWDDNDKSIATIIGDIAAGALSRPSLRSSEFGRKRRSKAIFLTVIVFVLISAIPVRLSSIATAELIPSTPFLVAPSFPAVVKRILVTSNGSVTAGQDLVELDDADQQAKVNVSKSELEVSEAEYRKYSQLGFQDQNSRYRLAEAEGQLKIKMLQLDRAKLELERTKLKSPISGVAIVADPLDWMGRPVQTGEKILLVADPSKVSVRLWVPATDGAILKESLSGELYLDSDPWSAKRVVIRNWSYEPEMSPQGAIAFRALAEADQGLERNRLLGLHGVVHLSGSRLPLILYLLRKPIIFLRQTFAI